MPAARANATLPHSSWVAEVAMKKYRANTPGNSPSEKEEEWIKRGEGAKVNLLHTQKKSELEEER